MQLSDATRAKLAERMLVWNGEDVRERLQPTQPIASHEGDNLWLIEARLEVEDIIAIAALAAELKEKGDG